MKREVRTDRKWTAKRRGAMMFVWWPMAVGLACQDQAGDPRVRALEFYATGSKLYVEGRYARAAEQLKLSLGLDDRQLRTAKLLGISYQLSGDAQAGEQAFMHATRLDARDSESWFFLGRIRYLENFFDRAEVPLQRAVELSPRDTRAREYLALTLEALGEIDRALQEYRRGIQDAGRRGASAWTLYLGYGMLLYKLGRFDESETQLVAARNLNPGHWQPWFELGKLHHVTGKLESAAIQLESALKKAATNEDELVRVRRVLARVYFALGRCNDAQKAIAAPDKIEK